MRERRVGVSRGEDGGRDHGAARGGAALEEFLTHGLDDVLACPAPGEAEERALALFTSVVATVPAYRAFLTEHDVDPAAVRTVTDFQALPPLTKDDYLCRHPPAQLCRSGELVSCDMIAVSSGSTGAPTFWPRAVADEFAVATRFEQVFHDSFGADQRTTLAVVCFALGTWVGGMYSASCCRHLAAKGYPITVITPGSNVEEILWVVTALGPQFEQVVLLGYPPYWAPRHHCQSASAVTWRRTRPSRGSTPRGMAPRRVGAGGDRLHRRARKNRYCPGLHRGAGRCAGP
ncbi:MAG: hypothetical protein JO364_08885 [Pseudonocardiales bacterium]|nr:hypothetical protein [Pseudonocardiales bacterium]